MSSKLETVQRYVVIIALIASIISLLFNVVFFFAFVNPHNKLIAELTENQSTLEQKLFDIQYPKPIINVTRVRGIEIGPSENISGTQDRASFSFNGTLILRIELFISTMHDGEFMISSSPRSLYLWRDKTSRDVYGFSGDVTMDEPFFYGVEATARNLQLDVSFVMSYRFRNSPILQEGYFVELAYLQFNLRFYDLQTRSTEFQEDLRANINWNNQTQMP